MCSFITDEDWGRNVWLTLASAHPRDWLELFPNTIEIIKDCKTFFTKRTTNVRMVHCVSQNNDYLHEELAEKQTAGTRWFIILCNNPGQHSLLSWCFGYVCAIPTAGTMHNFVDKQMLGICAWGNPSKSTVYIAKWFVWTITGLALGSPKWALQWGLMIDEETKSLDRCYQLYRRFDSILSPHQCKIWSYKKTARWLYIHIDRWE